MEKKKVFVIMPFYDPFYKMFDIINEKLGDEYDFCHAGKKDNQQNILKDIIQSIFEADVILADLSGKNSNVLYELGIAHTFNKKTIIITRDEKLELPFNLKSYRVVQYSAKSDDFSELISKLQETLKGAVDGSISFSNPVTDFLSYSDFDNLNQLHGFTELFRREIKKCAERGIYDERIMRTFKIYPDEKRKRFIIKSYWDFKTVSVHGKSPVFSFNHNSKFTEFKENFKVIRYEVNNVDRKEHLKDNLQYNFKEPLHYVMFSENLPLRKDNSVCVKCEYEFIATLPEYNSYSSYMYPAKNREVHVSIEEDYTKEKWVLKANSFTAFKNLGNNINSLYSDRDDYTEEKAKTRYDLNVTNWTLPGTGVAFTALKEEHLACRWLPFDEIAKLDK